MGLIRIVKELKGEVFIECPSCKKKISRDEAAGLLYTCPKCGKYFRVKTKNRIKMAADAGSFEDLFPYEKITNPLDFPEYEKKLEDTRTKTGLTEGVTIGRATINGIKCILGVCDSRFLMGSMGSVYGDRITSAVETATKERLPIILFCCSGGARMQEGIMSLMQMAKTAAALKRHSDAGLLYVPVLTDPTTGGVTASFAMLGDIILAEPGALIGFAGPRVIEQTIGQKLPAGFQSAEFLLEHGFVDMIVKRENLKDTLYRILKATKTEKNEGMTAGCRECRFTADFTEPIKSRKAISEILKERVVKNARELDAWEKVKEARSLERPTSRTFISLIFDDFIELHGDRYAKDDKAIVGGLATLCGMSAVVIGVQKGNTPAECAKNNFGMAGPEGYRKALRLMKLAEKTKSPILCLINTSGAYPGKEAEERGQGEAIARNLYEMSSIKVPILSIFIGEGGSGGALALAVANEVWMLENATYSVLSPEGFASILWKDSTRAKEAAQTMRITANELLKLNIIEKIIPEYGGADAISQNAIAANIRDSFIAFIKRYDGRSGEDIATERYNRFRSFGDQNA